MAQAIWTVGGILIVINFGIWVDVRAIRDNSSHARRTLQVAWEEYATKWRKRDPIDDDGW